VTPGMLSMIASRRSTKRLKNVDLPTLGRPTIATMFAMYFFRSAKVSLKCEGAKAGVVGCSVLALAVRTDRTLAVCSEGSPLGESLNFEH
jgi:hypothetical protein